MHLLRRLTAVATLLGPLFATTLARAEMSVEACAAAYTKGQEERLAGRLFAARTQFKSCSDPACPEAIVRDCARWKTEVDSDLPTIKAEVVDANGEAIPGFSFYVDGERIPNELLSEPLVLDPGPHAFRFEAPGHQAIQFEHSLTPEDRNVPLRATLRPLAGPKDETADKRDDATTTPETEAASGRPFPTLPVVLASVGVVSLGASLYFGLSAKSQFDDLEDTCAPNCKQSEADSVQTKALVSDITLVVGVAAVGAAAWLYFTSDKSPTKAAIGFEPRADGARANLRFRF